VQQAGIPAEWGPSGLTPATATAFIQSYSCAAGTLNGKPLAATTLAVIAGGVSNSPPMNDTNATVYTGDYLLDVVADQPVLVDYLAWKGFPAEGGRATVTSGNPYTMSWRGDGWTMQGDCVGQRDPSAGTLHFYHWRGNLSDPQTLFFGEAGKIGSTALGTMAVSGGVLGAELAPAGAAPTVCAVRHVDALSIRMP
jgi:hypothetical protein